MGVGRIFCPLKTSFTSVSLSFSVFDHIDGTMSII